MHSPNLISTKLGRKQASLPPLGQQVKQKDHKYFTMKAIQSIKPAMAVFPAAVGAALGLSPGSVPGPPRQSTALALSAQLCQFCNFTDVLLQAFGSEGIHFRCTHIYPLLQSLVN